MGSPAAPKRARVQEAPHSHDLPATLETFPPSLAELEGAAVLSNPDGEQHTEPRSEPPLLMSQTFLHLQHYANVSSARPHLDSRACQFVRRLPFMQICRDRSIWNSTHWHDLYATALRYWWTGHRRICRDVVMGFA